MMRRRDKKGKLESLRTFGPRQAQAVKTFKAAKKAGARKGEGKKRFGARMAQLGGRGESYNAKGGKPKRK